jgi:hypothetical protein
MNILLVKNREGKGKRLEKKRGKVNRYGIIYRE